MQRKKYKIGYFVSLGFTDTESVLEADFRQNRYNIRANLDAQFNDNLSAQVDMSYFQTTLDKKKFGINEMYNRLSTGKPTNQIHHLLLKLKNLFSLYMMKNSPCKSGQRQQLKS